MAMLHNVPDGHNGGLLRPAFESIPENLKKWPHWVNWRGEWTGRRMAKRPYSPVQHSSAAVNDSRTWGSYQQATAAYATGCYDGVGVVLGWAGSSDNFLMHPRLFGLD